MTLISVTQQLCSYVFVSDIAIFVPKRDVKLQLTNCPYVSVIQGDQKLHIFYSSALGALLGATQVEFHNLVWCQKLYYRVPRLPQSTHWVQSF